MKEIIIIGMAIIGILYGAVSCGATKRKELHEEYGVRKTITGAKIYTVVWKGCEYIVIEKHNGISICPRGESTTLPAHEDVFWNKPLNISPKK